MKHSYLFIALLTFNQLAVSQICLDRVTASTPDNRFSINGQEVTDTETGLIWQKCSLGQTGSDCSGGSAQALLTWDGALQAAEKEADITSVAWRLPNIKELSSIVEEKCEDPTINSAIFPNTIRASYWSASPYLHAQQGHFAWYIHFNNGRLAYYYFEGEKLYVRLVR